jgi:cytochrome c oxidase subunit 3
VSDAAAHKHHAERTGPDRYLQHHFQTIAQQTEATTMGMWAFLAQEVMFFGGLFCCYAVYRYMYPHVWEVGSSHLPLAPGVFNTVVLLLSSFSMAMGVYYTQVGNKKRLIQMLFLTLIFGIIFVVVKLQFEYMPKWEGGVFPGKLWNPHGHYADLAAPDLTGPAQIFFYLYFLMTGMHAFHMLIGFGILIVLIYGAFKDWFGPDRYTPIEYFGLYWHFVDIVWVFLFPLWYLVGGSPGAGH